MAANNETRIYKNNTIDELRQKTNEVSLHLGDNALIDSRILDKTIEFTADANQTLFTSGLVRFEIKPDQEIDDVSAGESFNVGVVKVYSDGTELTQSINADGFKVPNFSLLVTLQNSPTIPAEFVENAVLTQSGGFSGTLLSADSNVLRFKSTSGTFSASQNLGIPHTDVSKRIDSSDIVSSTAQDSAYGNIIELNTAASAGDVIKIVSTNVIDAVNEVQDDIGDITTLAAGIPSKSDVVVAVNSFKGEVGNAVDLTTSANTVVGAINEHETDIGDMVLTTTATDLTDAINEHDAELGTISSAAFGTTASTVSTAIAELHTDVDARLKLTSGTEQTLNTDIQFTAGNTLEFPANTTLDIRNGLLQTGAGGFQITTGFIDFNADIAERGLSFERSNFGNGADVKLYWDETYAATQPDRGFRIDGLNTGSTIETADLVTFYNAQDLIANNTETGISVVWDEDNQNFDFALTADPTISLSGDLSGSVALTNLATSTFNLTATIGSGVVENSMLAGSITASKLAGGIGNSLLTNSGFELDADSGTTNTVNLGETLSILGTSGEVETSVSGNTLTIGLPNNVTVGNNLTVTGNLTVQGTQTILNTETLTVEDTLVLAGNNLSSEPDTGGFGLEVGPITSPSGVASNVTGAHSIVYNYATDQWEADGSLILSEASVGTPSIEGTDFGSSKDLSFSAGTGLSETVSGLATSNYVVTYTNTDRGSSQNIFKNVATSSGTAVADNNNDTLTIVGGNDLSTSASADTITIQHDNSGVSAGSYGSRFVVPTITVDARGHVTAASSNSAITLSSLGYSGSTSADNYGSFNIRANTAATTAIGSGETITFTDSGATTVTRSGNTIDISSVNTTYSVGDGGLTQVNFTTARRDKLEGIAANANNYTWYYDTSGNGSDQTVSNGNVIRIQGTGATTVTHSGSTITIDSTDTNTDTNTITNIGVNSSNYTNGNINFQASGATSISKSGNTVTISSTDTNTTYSALSQFSNDVGYVTSSGVTSVSVSAGNGLSGGGTVTSTGTISLAINPGEGIQSGVADLRLSGSYNGTYTIGSTTSHDLRVTGDVIAFYSSDRSLKENIQPIENALEKVLKINGVTFDWKDEYLESRKGWVRKRDTGIIAQEVQEVLPEVVHEKVDGTLGVKYEKIIGLLIESIKDLKAEIEELKDINKGIEK